MGDRIARQVSLSGFSQLRRLRITLLCIPQPFVRMHTHCPVSSSPQKQTVPPPEFTSSPLFEKGAPALARLAVKNVREAVDNVDVARDKRAALVALLKIPWPMGSVQKVGTHNISVAIPAPAARPYLFLASRQLRKTVFEVRRAHLTYLEWDNGPRRRHVLVRARAFARLSPAGRENLFSNVEGMLTFTPGDPKSAPPSELHLVTGPSVHSEMLRELWNSARAYSQRSDRPVNIRPLSGARPFLHALFGRRVQRRFR